MRQKRNVININKITMQNLKNFIITPLALQYFIEYFMEGKKLEEIKEEKELGVLVSKHFKVSKQCLKAGKKGNQIKRTKTCKSKEIISRLYKS